MPHVPQTVEQQMERRQQGEISEVKLHLVGMIFFKEKKWEFAEDIWFSFIHQTPTLTFNLDTILALKNFLKKKNYS